MNLSAAIDFIKNPVGTYTFTGERFKDVKMDIYRVPNPWDDEGQNTGDLYVSFSRDQNSVVMFNYMTMKKYIKGFWMLLRGTMRKELNADC